MLAFFILSFAGIVVNVRANTSETWNGILRDSFVQNDVDHDSEHAITESSFIHYLWNQVDFGDASSKMTNVMLDGIFFSFVCI